MKSNFANTESRSLGLLGIAKKISAPNWLGQSCWTFPGRGSFYTSENWSENWSRKMQKWKKSVNWSSLYSNSVRGSRFI